jgi:NAD(P) transhydrogenase subunit alpha
VLRHDVKILAPQNAPSTWAEHASQMYARSIYALPGPMISEDRDSSLGVDREVIGGACIRRDGDVVHAAPRRAAGVPPAPEASS